MHINLLREPMAAAFLPLFWLCVLPGNASAQLPRIDAIAGTSDPISECICTWEERPLLAPSVCDESCGSAFLRFFREGEWYFSWGYSRESWANTNIHVSQPSQASNFTVYNVRATDDPSFGSLFSAQYNIRIGRFIDEARTVAVELNMDHTKYTSVTGQTARIAGTVNGKPIDANVRLDESVFSYNLHNGANHVMLNLVKRVPLIGRINESFSVAGIAKFGVGVLVPHSENIIFGQINDVGKKEIGNLMGIHRGWWQLDGFTTGVEAGFRIVLVKPVYLEITDKIAFAQLGDVPVFQGTARHNLWMNEVILSVGITFGGGR
jgi:hypothetical protein